MVCTYNATNTYSPIFLSSPLLPPMTQHSFVRFLSCLFTMSNSLFCFPVGSLSYSKISFLPFFAPLQNLSSLTFHFAAFSLYVCVLSSRWCYAHNQCHSCLFVCLFLRSALLYLSIKSLRFPFMKPANNQRCATHTHKDEMMHRYLLLVSLESFTRESAFSFSLFFSFCFMYLPSCTQRQEAIIDSSTLFGGVSFLSPFLLRESVRALCVPFGAPNLVLSCFVVAAIDKILDALLFLVFFCVCV